MWIMVFPHIFMRNIPSISYKSAKLWNLKYLEQNIDDPELTQYLSRLLSIYKHRGSSITDMGILSIDGQSVFDSEISPSVRERAKEFQLCIFLASLSKQSRVTAHANAGHFMTTADNYSFFIQGFKLGSDSTAESIGAIVTYRNLDLLEKMSFDIPRYVPAPINGTLNFDTGLLEKLAMISNASPRVYQRILSAIDSIYEANINDENVSINNRILSQARAFETLLRLPDKDQRLAFKTVIGAISDTPTENLYRHFYETRGGKKLDTRKRSLKYIWADAFYTLRNRIIHGNRVEASEYLFRRRQSHFICANIFFVQSIKYVISKRMRKKMFYDSVKWDRWDDGMAHYQGFAYDDGYFFEAYIEAVRKAKGAVR